MQVNLLEQNENMTNYFYYKHYFKSEDIEKIKEICYKYNVIDGNVSGKINKSYRTSQIRWIPKNEETKWIYDKIISLMKNANNKMWKFHITNLNDDLQFTEYKAEDAGHYDWHLDFGGERSSTRKLSVVVQLTDPETYKGGRLQFLNNRDIIEAPSSKGTVIFFPSYLLHRVTEMESGLRNSLVCWFHGPPFV